MLYLASLHSETAEILKERDVRKYALLGTEQVEVDPMERKLCAVSGEIDRVSCPSKQMPRQKMRLQAIHTQSMCTMGTICVSQTDTGRGYGSISTNKEGISAWGIEAQTSGQKIQATFVAVGALWGATSSGIKATLVAGGIAKFVLLVRGLGK